MNNKNDLSALTMLQIMMVLLKLSNVQPISTWSWIWVFAFSWIPFTLGLIALGILKGISNK